MTSAADVLCFQGWLRFEIMSQGSRSSNPGLKLANAFGVNLPRGAEAGCDRAMDRTVMSLGVCGLAGEVQRVFQRLRQTGLRIESAHRV